MAFNPFITFQKNRRFWMAAILMICMVSFVFCTGMRGDLADKLIYWTTGRSGPAAIEIDGRTYSRRDLDALKTQRNLANVYMRKCTEIAFHGIQKSFFALKKDEKEAKDLEKRAQRLSMMEEVMATLTLRQQRPRYFDGDVKFWDLVEFKLWQAEADRLGIQLQDEHITYLFLVEFFMSLDKDDLRAAEYAARRDVREATSADVRRAIAEEFRVKIAQYAVFGAQPSSYLFRKRPELGNKTLDPNVPDQMRAPMTLAQLWDAHKAKRSAFEVKLIPLHVEDFANNKFDVPFVKEKVREPSASEEEKFFEDHKNYPYDPSSAKWSLEIPLRASFQYLIADPNSPDYIELAKTVGHLRAISPFDYQPFSPISIAARSTAIRYALMTNKHLEQIDTQYNQETAKVGRYRGAALFAEKDFASPILAYYAARHPQGVMSLLGASALAPEQALAGYLAWGTKQAPLQAGVAPPDDAVKGAKESWTDEAYRDAVKKLEGKGKVQGRFATNDAELAAALDSEVKRRVPVYATLFASSMNASPLNLGVAATSFHLDTPIFYFSKQRGPRWDYYHAHFTTATVQSDIEDMLARRTAESWAQDKFGAALSELKKASGGVSPAESFRRELSQLVSDRKLIHGPPDNQKANYYDRFTIDQAKEFAPLREAFERYLTDINLFEGRDTPEKRLKPSDFHTMFFGNESFSATGRYQPKPWPPEVDSSKARSMRFADPRLYKDVGAEDLKRFEQFIADRDPDRLEVAKMALYKTAAKPILFWRTDEIPAERRDDYKKLVQELKQTTEERIKLEAEFKTSKDDADLENKLAGVKKKEADLLYVKNRVTEGWKFKRARDEQVLPHAKELARKLIEFRSAPAVIDEQAAKLMKPWEKVPAAEKQSRGVITLPGLSLMQKENVAGSRFDYFAPSLPKDLFIYPRDNMMEQIVSLYDLQGPIVHGGEENKDIDELNKALYEEAKKHKQPDRFVQVLANKARSVFYVAMVTAPPRESPIEFMMAMHGASYGHMQFMSRDLFVDRVQKQFADSYRQDFLRGLQSAHNFKVRDEEAITAFDGKQD